MIPKNIRSYTPVTGDEVLGTVTFVIKVYKAGIHPKFPEGGKMSQYLDTLKIGDTMDMKGPKGNLHYVGKGQFSVKELGKPLVMRKATHFGMIAGGTGITPCVQVIEAILRDEKDTSIIHLLYANQSMFITFCIMYPSCGLIKESIVSNNHFFSIGEEDILLHKEIDTLEEKFKNRLSVHYTVDRPTPGWKGSTGFVTKDMIQQYVLPKDRSAWKSSSTQILMCGPPPMLKFACIPALKELELEDAQLFCF
jgi:cytochrome-b5 reductase